jgi:DNA-binding MarR family transcriptional regulator
MQLAPDDRPVPNKDMLRELLHRLSRDHRDLDADAAELGDRLWSTSVQMVRAFEAHVQRYQTSMARLGVLLNLWLAPGHKRTPSQISESIRVSRPTVTGVIEGLVNADLVRRSAHPDNRRNQLVQLTAKGLRFIEGSAVDYFRHIAAAVLALNPQEKAALQSALDLMSRLEIGISNGLPLGEPNFHAESQAKHRRGKPAARSGSREKAGGVR